MRNVFIMVLGIVWLWEVAPLYSQLFEHLWLEVALIVMGIAIVVHGFIGSIKWILR